MSFLSGLVEILETLAPIKSSKAYMYFLALSGKSSTFLIPLVASPTDIDQEKVKTVTYNQHFYHGAKKFFNGENDTKNVYNPFSISASIA